MSANDAPVYPVCYTADGQICLLYNLGISYHTHHADTSAVNTIFYFKCECAYPAKNVFDNGLLSIVHLFSFFRGALEVLQIYCCEITHPCANEQAYLYSNHEI